MKIKIFYPDFDGRISLTKEELEKLLDEVYNEGYDDCRKAPRVPITWISPYWPSNTAPYYTTISTSSSSISSDSNYVSSSLQENNLNNTSNYTSYTTVVPKEPDKYSEKAIKYVSQ